MKNKTTAEQVELQLAAEAIARAVSGQSTDEPARLAQEALTQGVLSREDASRWAVQQRLYELDQVWKSTCN